jgi:pimeloyl-ACP methyl ester carboxylesterase
MTTVTTTATTATTGAVAVSTSQEGTGRPFLLLHGGAGPQSVAGFADLLAGTGHARVLTPTHPGFNGTLRPDQLDSIKALAEVYSRLVDELGLVSLTVMGNSIGGWIAAELALLHNDHISCLVLVDAVGVKIDTHPIVDFFALDMNQVADLSYYNPPDISPSSKHPNASSRSYAYLPTLTPVINSSERANDNYFMPAPIHLKGW